MDKLIREYQESYSAYGNLLGTYMKWSDQTTWQYFAGYRWEQIAQWQEHNEFAKNHCLKIYDHPDHYFKKPSVQKEQTTWEGAKSFEEYEDFKTDPKNPLKNVPLFVVFKQRQNSEPSVVSCIYNEDYAKEVVINLSQNTPNSSFFYSKLVYAQHVKDVQEVYTKFGN